MKRLNSSNCANTPPVGLRRASLLLALLLSITFGVGQMWGATYSGTFQKCTGTLTSGYYVFGNVESTTMHAVNNTVGTSWIKFTDVTISSNKITNPDAGVVWYYDASAGTIKNADNTNYIYWTSGNVGCCGTTSYAHTVTETSTSGIYIVASKNTSNRILRRNNTSGYRYYTTSTGTQEISFYKLTSSCSNKVTLTKGSTANGTFDLDKSNGSYDNCDANFVVHVSNIVPASNAQYCNGINATGGYSTVTGPVDGVWTVTYTKGNNITSTITPTYADKTPASITFVNAGTPAPTTTGYYVDDSYTLPSTNNYNCSGGKTFVGWSTVEVASTDTKPSSNFYEPGANVTLGASQTFYAVFANVTPGDAIKYDPFSATLGGSSGNTITSGYTLTTQAESKAGFYQDGSGTLRYVQVKSTTVMFSTTPASITVTAKIGGGTSGTNLDNPVYAQLVDANGDPIGTAASITNYITTNTGDTYSNISIPTTGITSAYGLRIYHTKESGYNVRYYSMSLSYTVDGTTYSAYSTDCCDPLGSINGSFFWTTHFCPAWPAKHIS